MMVEMTGKMKVGWLVQLMAEMMAVMMDRMMVGMTG